MTAKEKIKELRLSPEQTKVVVFMLMQFYATGAKQISHIVAPHADIKALVLTITVNSVDALNMPLSEMPNLGDDFERIFGFDFSNDLP